MVEPVAVRFCGALGDGSGTVPARRAVKRDSLVLSNRFGKVLNPEGFSQQFSRRVAAFRDFHPSTPQLHVHGLRHTHATLLLLAGKHPKIVQERLGHAQISITLNTYSHVIPTLQREAADAIGELLSAPVVAPVVARPISEAEREKEMVTQTA